MIAQKILCIGIIILMKRLFIVFFVFLTLFIFGASFTYAQINSNQKEERIEAKVLKVLETSQIIESDGRKHPYQRLQLEGISGSLSGKNFEIENGMRDQTGIATYKTGDSLVLTIMNDASGKQIITITDYVRRNTLYLLAAVFVILTVIIGGRRGASSIFGMLLTFILLFTYVLPQLSKGANPYIVSMIASLIVIPVTFYLSHGINKKTLCAIIGTFIALIFTMLLSFYFINQAHLTGFASEEAGFLDVMKNGAINIKGLLFAGVVIALLGILEDITVSQAAIVFQLKKANKDLSGFELFRRAMDVGRDHIASMANTLILVYAGASLPLLLLFIDNPLPFSAVINTEMIAEEIVRTLTASIGLILAVPITTAITALFLMRESGKKQ